MVREISGLWNFMKNNVSSRTEVEKKPISSKIVQKWLFVSFAISAIEASDRNDYKLDKTAANVQ